MGLADPSIARLLGAFLMICVQQRGRIEVVGLTRLREMTG
jgi:hypothetical protein